MACDVYTMTLHYGTLFLIMGFGAVNGLISVLLKLNEGRHLKRTLLEKSFYINVSNIGVKYFRIAVSIPNINLSIL
jgi:hypothetical protein